MNDLINNEYVHLALSILCVVWGVYNIRRNAQPSMENKKRSKTFRTMDNGYSYLVIAIGGFLLIWTMYNIVSGEA